jgi:hypothetical protein
MNPFVEQDDAWHDFRKRFIPLAAEIIGEQVQPNDIVKIAKHIYVDESLAFIEIRDRKSRGLVTVIELLSPSNKRAGADRENSTWPSAGSSCRAQCTLSKSTS